MQHVVRRWQLARFQLIIRYSIRRCVGLPSDRILLRSTLTSMGADGSDLRELRELVDCSSLESRTMHVVVNTWLLHNAKALRDAYLHDGLGFREPPDELPGDEAPILEHLRSGLQRNTQPSSEQSVYVFKKKLEDPSGITTIPKDRCSRRMESSRAELLNQVRTVELGPGAESCSSSLASIVTGHPTVGLAHDADPDRAGNQLFLAMTPWQLLSVMGLDFNSRCDHARALLRHYSAGKARLNTPTPEQFVTGVPKQRWPTSSLYIFRPANADYVFNLDIDGVGALSPAAKKNLLSVRQDTPETLEVKRKFETPGTGALAQLERAVCAAYLACPEAQGIDPKIAIHRSIGFKPSWRLYVWDGGIFSSIGGANHFFHNYVVDELRGLEWYNEDVVDASNYRPKGVDRFMGMAKIASENGSMRQMDTCPMEDLSPESHRVFTQCPNVYFAKCIGLVYDYDRLRTNTLQVIHFADLDLASAATKRPRVDGGGARPDSAARPSHDGTRTIGCDPGLGDLGGAVVASVLRTLKFRENWRWCRSRCELVTGRDGETLFKIKPNEDNDNQNNFCCHRDTVLDAENGVRTLAPDRFSHTANLSKITFVIDVTNRTLSQLCFSCKLRVHNDDFLKHRSAGYISDLPATPTVDNFVSRVKSRILDASAAPTTVRRNALFEPTADPMEALFSVCRRNKD